MESYLNMRVCEIKLIEVINLCNCKKLGHVSDVEVNLCTGKIEAIIVSKGIGVYGFFLSDTCYLIPYECIKNIGEGLIFVEVCEEKCIIPCKKCFGDMKKF